MYSQEESGKKSPSRVSNCEWSLEKKRNDERKAKKTVEKGERDNGVWSSAAGDRRAGKAQSPKSNHDGLLLNSAAGFTKPKLTSPKGWVYVGSKQKSFGPPSISHAAYLVFEMGQGCEKGGSKKLGALKSKSAPIVCNSKTVSGLATLDLNGSDGPIPGHGGKGPRIGPTHLNKSTRASVGTPLSISPMEKFRAPEEKSTTKEGAFTARDDKEK